MGVDGVSRQTGGASWRDQRAPAARLISSKNLYILPIKVKETVELPDFVKESVSQTQILYTFQARIPIVVDPKLE